MRDEMATIRLQNLLFVNLNVTRMELFITVYGTLPSDSECVLQINKICPALIL